jgi:hypothetical protein
LEMESLKLFAQADLKPQSSQVARITGMNHQHQATCGLFYPTQASADKTHLSVLFLPYFVAKDYVFHSVFQWTTIWGQGYHYAEMKMANLYCAPTMCKVICWALYIILTITL